MSGLNKENPNFTIFSRNRINGTISDFSINIQLLNGHPYDLCALTRFTMPKTYYTISAGNNTLTVQENGLSSFGITIPNGYYNVYNFPPLLESLLNAGSVQGLGYTVSYSEITKKITITQYGAIALGSITFNSYLSKIMGFTSPTLAIAFPVVSQKPVNFQKTQFIAIASDLGSNDGAIDSESNILVRIPVENTPDGEMIIYEIKHIQDQSRSLNSQVSGVYHFTLLDDNGQLLELQNDYTFDLFYYEFDYYHSLRIAQIESEQKQLKLKEQEKLTSLEQQET